MRFIGRGMAVAAAALLALPVAAAGPAMPQGRAAPLTIAGLPGVALLDGGMHVANDGSSFVLGVPAAEVGRTLAANGIPAEGFPISIQPLLVRDGRRVLLFDTGAGTTMGGEGGRLAASLALAHVRPDAVTDIFISHVHGDHVGGLVTLQGTAAFPNARVHISRPEWAWLRTMSDADAAKIGLPEHARLVAAITPQVDPFAPGAALVGGRVRAVAIEGHTPGHSAYLIGTGPQSVLFIGDSMHSHVLSVAHPEWHVAFDTDADTGARSRVAAEARWVATRQRIFAGHFPFPGYGTIVRVGDTYRWQPLAR